MGRRDQLDSIMKRMLNLPAFRKNKRGASVNDIVSIQNSFAKLVRQAEQAGIVVVADSDAIAIRLIPMKEAKQANDLRRLGVTIRVHNACGGACSSIGGHPSTHTT